MVNNYLLLWFTRLTLYIFAVATVCLYNNKKEFDITNKEGHIYMKDKLLRSFYALRMALSVLALTMLMAMNIGSAIADETQSKSILPEKITIDYANWNILSLVLKNGGFLEDEFKKDNVEIQWVFSTGGNKGMEFLLSKSADFAGSAQMPQLLSFINGNPITAIYVFYESRFAIVKGPNTNINSVKDLKGKNFAVTLSTGPHAYLLRALEANGMDIKDLNVISLQQADGNAMLLQGKVDAFVGGLLYRTLAEFGGGKVLYENRDFTDFDLLNVRTEFLEEYPEAVYRVLAAYERARQWTKDNPEEFLKLIEKSLKVNSDVAKRLHELYNLSTNAINDKVTNNIIQTGLILQKHGMIKKDVDVESSVHKLYNRSVFEEAQKRL